MLYLGIELPINPSELPHFPLDYQQHIQKLMNIYLNRFFKVQKILFLFKKKAPFFSLLEILISKKGKEEQKIRLKKKKTLFVDGLIKRKQVFILQYHLT